MRASTPNRFSTSTLIVCFIANPPGGQSSKLAVRCKP